MSHHAKSLVLVVALLGAICLNGLMAQEVKQNQWPQFRGPLGTGEAPQADPPTEWSEDRNIRWKIPLPGLGHSTPVVWGEQIFVTTSIPFGEKFPGKPDTDPKAHDNVRVTQKHRFLMIAINRKDGSIAWRKNLKESTPHEGGHYTSSQASASPVCDDQHVIGFFGSHGLYCLTHDGQVVWQKNLGAIQSKHNHGEGASPALLGDTLVVNWDHEGQSFVVAFDKATGKEKWRVARNEMTSWSSPIAVDHKGLKMAIVAGTNRIRAYDLDSGSVLWSCGGLSQNVCATPIYFDGVVYAGSSYDTRNFMAIDIDGAQGDLTGSSRVLWSRRQQPPYVPSPLLYQGAVYYHRHYQGVLSRINARTGAEEPGPIRLPIISNVYGSPVAAAGRIYVTDLRGTTRVLKAGAKPDFISRNRLDDSFSATAVLVGKEILLRGRKYLYCIAETPAE
ncbi:MAG: PQQ-binding-like beta-propeller repeat protein [Planctomycetaceae bacterium]